jgi:hypothetical protein
MVSDNFADSGAEGDEMSRPRLISDATADFLLAGGEVDDPTVQDLAQVLAAASAPGSARELYRESTAAAAFTAAHLTQPRRRGLSGRMLMSALGVKLTAALAAAAVGGIVLAASTGVLPDPLHPAPSSSDMPRPAVSAPGGPVRSVTPSPRPTPRRSSLQPSLRGLCSAYLASSSADERNKHLPAALITAAGGVDKVEGYCVGLVGMSTKPKPMPPVPPSRTPLKSKQSTHTTH